MKRLLASFFLYLEQFDTNSGTIDLEMEGDGITWWNRKVWVSKLGKDVSIPSNFLPLIDMIIENYGGEIWRESKNEEGDEWYRATLEFNVNDKTLTITSEITENGSDETGDTYDIDNEDVRIFLKENDLKTISIHYEGGGDSGYIEEKGKGDNGEEYELSSGVQDIAYTYLERSFGGWENNEGAQGDIYITENELSIDHVWFTREMVDSELNLTIKLDNL